MNLGELRAYIRSRYACDLADADLDQHLNETYRDLAKLWTADTTSAVSIPTVGGQGLYDLTVGTRKIKYVTMGSTRLKSVHPDAVVFPQTAGTPARWFPYGMTINGKQTIGVDPKPTTSGSTISVNYEPEPTLLSTDSGTPEYVPSEYHHLIGYGALALAAGQQQDYNVAQHWESRYRSAYNELLVRFGKAKQNFPEAAKQGGG